MMQKRALVTRGSSIIGSAVCTQSAADTFSMIVHVHGILHAQKVHVICRD